jgi:hypothetical protein
MHELEDTVAIRPTGSTDLDYRTTVEKSEAMIDAGIFDWCDGPAPKSEVPNVDRCTGRNSKGRNQTIDIRCTCLAVTAKATSVAGV